MLATATPAKSERIAVLDFTKGALVLFMVLYHWVNYFIGMNWPYYRYLRFLSPSFIFISGFMISNVYLARYKVVDFRLSKRLFTRGAKLLVIFVVLNLSRTLVLPLFSSGISSVQPFDIASVLATFVTGNFTSKIVSFSILVPIGYLLMVAGLLMPAFRRFGATFHIAFVLFFLSALVLEWMSAQSMNLEIITIGMLGVVVGLTALPSISRIIVQHPYWLALTYILYTIAITIYGVPFLLQIAGVCLTLMVIYLIGIKIEEHTKIRDTVDLLGKYSLFGYIFQIVILQLLAVSVRRYYPSSYILFATFGAAFALTIIGVEVLDRSRRGVATVDKLYKAVFN